MNWRIERLARLGFEVELIGTECMQELIADLKIPGPDAVGVFYPWETHMDPTLYIKDRPAKTIALGVSVQSPAQAINLIPPDRGRHG